MAGQNVRDPALVIFDEVPVALPVVPSHGCVEIEDTPYQPVFHGLDAELHGRVIPVHVPNLDSQVSGFRLVQQLFELRQRFAARFVQMDVLSGPDASQGGRDTNAFFGFDGHGLKTGNGQQFVRGHHFQSLETTALLGFLAPFRVVLHKADNLEEISQFA